jgi:hypothetical protein
MKATATLAKELVARRPNVIPMNAKIATGSGGRSTIETIHEIRLK